MWSRGFMEGIGGPSCRGSWGQTRSQAAQRDPVSNRQGTGSRRRVLLLTLPLVVSATFGP